MRKNAFTEEQRNRVYDLVQQSITKFFDENEKEFTLLKNLSTNTKVRSFLAQFKQSFAGNEEDREAGVVGSSNIEEDKGSNVIQENKKEVKKFNGYPKPTKESINGKEQNKVKGGQVESPIESKKTKKLESTPKTNKDNTIQGSKKNTQKEGNMTAKINDNPRNTAAANKGEGEIYSKVERTPEANNKQYPKFHTRNYTADDNFKKVKSALSKEASKKQQNFITSHALSDIKPTAKHKVSHAKHLSQAFTESKELAVDKQKQYIEQNYCAQNTIKRDKAVPKKTIESKNEISPPKKTNAKGSTAIFVDQKINKKEIHLPESSAHKAAKNKSPSNKFLKKELEKRADFQLKEVVKSSEQKVKELNDSELTDTPMKTQLSKIKEDESDSSPEKEEFDIESSDEVEAPKDGKVKLRLSTKQYIERLAPYFMLIV
jgi:hypothetical protein